MDCSEIPDSTCTVRISGSKEEVMKVGMRHAVEDHNYPDTEETRKQLSGMIKEE